jgi:hypothetical protein
MVTRKARDPLLALEFLSLTFACGSRPPAQATTSETDGSSTSSSTTTQPDTEDTNPSDWGLDYGEYDF